MILVLVCGFLLVSIDGVAMKSSAVIQRMLAFGASGIASLCLLNSTAGAPENPSDPTDVAGIPAVSMYVVILLFFLFVSFCCLVIGLIVERYLGAANKTWRFLGYCFGVFSLVITSGLGFFVSLAFSEGTLMSYAAVVLYGLSIYFLLASWLRFKSERVEKF